MAITIKNSEQIKHMRAVGLIVAKTHELLEKAIRPGVTTKELDQLAEEFIKSNGATASFKGYRGFPSSICSSINEEVIHGIPSLRKLKDGDIVSIDIGAYLNGYHGDAARTHPVGNVSEVAKKLIEVTRQSFYEGMKFAKEGCHLYEVSGAIQNHVESNGFSIVRDYVGHGIGKNLHESPEIPNFRSRGKGPRGPRLSKGMTLAIEPMVNEGDYEIDQLEDNWTVVTIDKKLSAHYENTILITDSEPEILTVC